MCNKKYGAESEEEHHCSRISENDDSDDNYNSTSHYSDSSELDSLAESIECSDQDLFNQTVELPDQTLHEEKTFCKHQFEKKFREFRYPNNLQTLTFCIKLTAQN